MNNTDKQIEEVTDRMTWLEKAWVKQVRKINQWSNRLMGELSKNGTPPKLIHRFAAMLQQIEFLKVKEEKIINEIKFFERQHAFLRAQNKLRRAEPGVQKEKSMANEGPRSPKERGLSSFVKMLLAMFMFSSRHSERNDL